MSKFTTQVRYICEAKAGYWENQGYSQVEECLEKSAPLIFNFPFPIFDENYRLILEKNILRYYYTREICAETVGLWQLWLSKKMNVIMPKYNMLYKALNWVNDKNSNIFDDTNLSETRDIKRNQDTKENESVNTDGTTATNGNSNTTQSGSTTNKEIEDNLSWDKYSDTPQGAVTDLDSDRYMTNARKVTENNTLTSNGTSANSSETTTVNTGTSNEQQTSDKQKNVKNTEDYVKTIIGKAGGKSYMELYSQYIEKIESIDMMIINELSDLFFGLYE